MPKQLEIPFPEFQDKTLPIPFEEYEDEIANELKKSDDDNIESKKDCGK